MRNINTNSTICGNKFLNNVIRLVILFNIISSLIFCEYGLITWKTIENEFNKMDTFEFNIRLY